MFPQHDPARQTFEFIRELSGARDIHLAAAAIRLRDHVRKIRKLYKQPVGGSFPYHDLQFQFAYLIAYFPSYIEPLYHVLKSANLPADIHGQESLKVSFFGGGPCPEMLGLAAYLREQGPALQKVDISIFDREPTWLPVQQVLLPDMLPDYSSPQTTFNIRSRKCNVLKCPVSQCHCGVEKSHLIISQNFLTEVYFDQGRALQTFESLIHRSGCRYLVLIDNCYPETKRLMNTISQSLFAKKICRRPVRAQYNSIYPNFEHPEVLIRNLYADEDGLRAKKEVKYYYIVIEIAR